MNCALYTCVLTGTCVPNSAGHIEVIGAPGIVHHITLYHYYKTKNMQYATQLSTAVPFSPVL